MPEVSERPTYRNGVYHDASFRSRLDQPRRRSGDLLGWALLGAAMLSIGLVAAALIAGGWYLFQVLLRVLER